MPRMVDRRANPRHGRARGRADRRRLQQGPRRRAAWRLREEPDGGYEGRHRYSSHWSRPLSRAWFLRLEAELGATVLHRVQRVYNGVAVLIDRDDLARVAEMPGVPRCTHCRRRVVNNAVSEPFIGAVEAWTKQPDRDRRRGDDRHHRHRHRLHSLRPRRSGSPRTTPPTNLTTSTTACFPTKGDRRVGLCGGHV